VGGLSPTFEFVHNSLHFSTKKKIPFLFNSLLIARILEPLSTRNGKNGNKLPGVLIFRGRNGESEEDKAFFCGVFSIKIFSFWFASGSKDSNFAEFSAHHIQESWL
jgi:hypothetical protein